MTTQKRQLRVHVPSLCGISLIIITPSGIVSQIVITAGGVFHTDMKARISIDPFCTTNTALHFYMLNVLVLQTTRINHHYYYLYCYIPRSDRSEAADSFSINGGEQTTGLMTYQGARFNPLPFLWQRLTQ